MNFAAENVRWGYVALIALIDNYDSFVHNLARYLRLLGQEVVVVRNDDVTVADVARMSPAAIVLSPGPCSPREAGCCLELVAKLQGEFPLLGVCLGHQTIAQALGGRVWRAARPMHGRASWVQHDRQGEFRDLPSPLAVGRYHSLVVEPESLPPELSISAWADDLGELWGAAEPAEKMESDGFVSAVARISPPTVMAIRHQRLPIVGWQFHPESILTPQGYDLLRNWLLDLGCDLPPIRREWCDEFVGAPPDSSLVTESFPGEGSWSPAIDSRPLAPPSLTGAQHPSTLLGGGVAVPPVAKQDKPLR